VRRKHIPQRRCVACRQVQSKREMIRLVRTPEGELVIDETGKRNGRSALKGKQLSHALKTDIGENERDTLRRYLVALSD
jgi:predicted RNA-binding protein YlxR (DUF448 family)